MRTLHLSALAFLASGLIGAFTACGGDSDGTRTRGDGSGGEGNGSGGTGGSLLPGGGEIPIEGEPWPADPIIEADAPANVVELFDGATPSGTGPCVHEPQDGTLVPRNWLRPRFRMTAAAGETVYQIRLASELMEHDLVAYTGSSAWAMPKKYWGGIAQLATSQIPVSVTIRATTTSGGAVSESTTSFLIAPAEAGGSMVYWATKASGNSVDATKLVGFAVGDEGTVDALLPNQIAESGFVDEVNNPLPDNGAGQGKVTCIGCHTSTPDGKAVAFNGNWPWPGVLASVEEDTVGERPAYVTDAAATALKMPFIGTFTFSKAFWSEQGGRAVGVIQAPANYEGWNMWDGTTRNIVQSAELVWFDLGASATVATGGTSVSGEQGSLWDFIPRTGDTRAVANPVWSHDGATIVYASCGQVAGGHPGGIDASDGITPLASATECDIYKVPYGDGSGGAATPVAAESGKAEYYPDLSYDDALVAYTRAPVATGYHYYRADGEIWVTAVGGGAPTRLAANDPPSNSAACPSEQSPGVINSWPKWSPSGSSDAAGNQYYWLIFSSGRSYPEQFELPADQWTPTNLDRRSSQLYLAAVVVDKDGTVTTYPATYIWNQTTDTANLTPAWDEFKIPPVVVR